MANETPEAKGESEGMTAKDASCATCGRPRREWRENSGKGVEKDGLLCCSRACAERLNDGVPSGRSAAR
jgi:hypothetical protein